MHDARPRSLRLLPGVDSSRYGLSAHRHNATALRRYGATALRVTHLTLATTCTPSRPCGRICRSSGARLPGRPPAQTEEKNVSARSTPERDRAAPLPAPRSPTPASRARLQLTPDSIPRPPPTRLIRTLTTVAPRDMCHRTEGCIHRTTHTATYLATVGAVRLPVPKRLATR